MNFAKTSFWITVLLVGGYILAFAKESFIANYFGISNHVDAYNIAIQIPVIVFSFVAVAIKSVIIPLYSDLYFNKGQSEANHFASSFITLNIFIAVAFFLVGELFADLIIKLFAPGFDKETHDIAVNLLRLTLPTMIFTVVTDIVTGILNVHKRLVMPCLAVYLLQVCIIAMTVLFHSTWGIGAACVGQVLGSFLQMLYLYLIALKVYHYRFSTDFKAPEIKKAIKMSGPVIWGISIAEVNAVVNRMIGSFLFVGSISALSYAGKLNSVFMTFCVQAVSIVIFPLYAESAAKNDMEQLGRRVNYTLSVYATMLLPVMCIVFCLREEIVEIAFARGAFDMNAVDLTKGVLGCYVVGMLFSAFRETLTKVFYSLKDTATVAKNATIGVVLNIALNLTLPWILGVKGLALGASISAMFIASRLLWLMKNKNEAMKLDYFFNNIKIAVIASAVTFLLLLVSRQILIGSHTLVRFFVCGTIAGLSYLVVLLIARAPIIKEISNYIKTNKKH